MATIGYDERKRLFVEWFTKRFARAPALGRVRDDHMSESFMEGFRQGLRIGQTPTPRPQGFKPVVLDFPQN